MKKNAIILFAIAFSGFAFSQVGISTSNPQGTFHVDGAKDNPATGTPTAAQSLNDMVITSTGDVGVGTVAPAAKVDIIGDTFGVRRAQGGGSWDNIWFDITDAFAPSINASGAETGLQFKVGANATGVYGNGQTLVTAATIRPNGNVGIGITAPAEKLSVVDAGNANQFQGTASFWAQNMTRGVGIGYGGIQAIGSVTNADLNLNAKATGNIIMQNSGTTGNVGIGTTPTDKLDVNGTTRVRSIPVAAGAVVITPVYADGSGVLSKAVNTAYGTVINNSVTVAAGATGQLITGLTNGTVYKAYVILGDGCANIATAEYFVTNYSSNNFFGLNGQGGHTSGNGANNNPTFNQLDRFRVQSTWTYPNCQDGGNATAFNYTLAMPSAGTINITNNGNIPKSYTIILTRLN